MDMNKLRTPATLTLSERVSSAAGRKCTCFWQSLSSSVFVKIMCVRSQMCASIINVAVYRAAAVARSSKENNEKNVVIVPEQMETGQEDWEEKILHDVAIKMLHRAFEDLVV